MSNWSNMKIMQVVTSVYEHRKLFTKDKELWSNTCNEVADLLTILPSTIWEPRENLNLKYGYYLHPLTFIRVIDFRLYTRNNNPYEHPYAVMVLADVKDNEGIISRRLLIIFRNGTIMKPTNIKDTFTRLPSDNRYIIWRSMQGHKLGVILEDNLPRPY